MRKIDSIVSRMVDIEAKLTPREWSIAKAVAEGLSYEEIAERFHISFHTVASHVKSILRKTGQPSSRRLAALIRNEQG